MVFDANSLLFLLILCLLYYFPEFFVELASTEIFCAQEKFTFNYFRIGDSQ